MTREEAITNIAQLCVFTHVGTTVGILLPSYEDVRRFQAEVVAMLEPLPKWVFPGLHRKTIRQIETTAGTRISFMNNVHHTRGQSFTSLYVSTKIPEDEMTQYCFVVMPLMASGRRMIKFDDE